MHHYNAAQDAKRILLHLIGAKITFSIYSNYAFLKKHDFYPEKNLILTYVSLFNKGLHRCYKY